MLKHPLDPFTIDWLALVGLQWLTLWFGILHAISLRKRLRPQEPPPFTHVSAVWASGTIIIIFGAMQAFIGGVMMLVSNNMSWMQLTFVAGCLFELIIIFGVLLAFQQGWRQLANR